MSDFQLQQASESPGLQQASESPGRSAKTQIRLLDLFLHSEFQIQQERGEGSRLCISNKLADDPGAAGPHAESTKLSPSFQIPRTECCPRERNTDHYLIISLNTHTQVCTHTHTHTHTLGGQQMKLPPPHYKNRAGGAHQGHEQFCSVLEKMRSASKSEHTACLPVWP